MSRSSSHEGLQVPAGRLARLARLGGLAAGVAGRVLADGVRGLARGERPGWEDLLLTPTNVLRATERLAEMRGAAMKVGQLVSMDAGQVLPPELAQILGQLREGAASMPTAQLDAVLAAELGSGWRSLFASFDLQPVAAASIGQVHRAQATDGRDLAVKVQYPGVARSIDSDVDNVATLLRLSGLLPSGLDVAPLLAEAKQQLHEEADYLREGASLERAGRLLIGDERFVVPAFHTDLSTPRVLAMSWAEGLPLETVGHAAAAERDRVGATILDLALRELFVWGWMQTDPNLGNYRYDPSTGRVVLLDFGATRDLSPALVDFYRDMLRAARDGDRAVATAALQRFGMLDAATPARVQTGALDLFEFAADRLLRQGTFDFSDAGLLDELRDRGLMLAADRAAWRVPPAEALFVQRKLGGLYLLIAQLGARVDLSKLVEPYV